MKEICIIGGSGFIGSCLAKKIEKKLDLNLTIIDKNMSASYPHHTKIADIRSIEDLRSNIQEGSLIVNLAAEHRDDVRPLSLYYDVNVKGSENICNVAREKSVNTIVFTSTVAVYGFAPIGTDENGLISPFNDYGESKYLAEKIYKEWQEEEPDARTLIIIRPTVIFGEQNRGNVYNLFNQVHSGRFVMIGDGLNRKSMGYVENISAFIDYSFKFKSGIHLFNYVDKPDLDMNTLISNINKILGRSNVAKFRIPFWIGYAVAKCFDFVAILTRNKFTISSIRVKKFCADSVYNTAINQTGFVSPVSLDEAITRTIKYEFIEENDSTHYFYTE
jgi:GlcNAc-P-P-Und epimerase